MSILEHCLVPDWPAPKNVRALQTTRYGGASVPPYDSFNLGDHVGDNSYVVAHNRQFLASIMPSEPVWLRQVHGNVVVDASKAGCLPQADAAVTQHPGTVCVVMTADCLPLLLCDEAGTVVGVAHAGWKGLAAGVIEATVQAMDIEPEKLLVWLGPAISQRGFEVGAEVRDIFVAQHAQASEAFLPGVKGKWMADIYLLAHQRLHGLGISQVYGGQYCTYNEPTNFFSYRRDGVTGRMGTFIWLEQRD